MSKKSVVWKVFVKEETPTGTKVRCKLCLDKDVVLSFKNATSNMKDHLKVNHPEILIQHQAEKQKAQIDAGNSFVSQLLLI